MANPTRPAIFPEWFGTQVQPTHSEAETGFIADFRPPAEWHNWLFGQLYLWVLWLDFISNPGSIGEPVESSAFNFAIPQTDYLCNVSAASFAGTLPLASSVPGQSFLAKNISYGSANVMHMTPQSADSIEGGTAGAVLDLNAGDVRRVTSDGINGWWLTNT